MYNNVVHTKNTKHTVSSDNKKKIAIETTQKPKEQWKYIEILQYPKVANILTQTEIILNQY